MEGEGTTSVVGGPCDSLQVVGLHSGTMGHGRLLSRSVRKNTGSSLNAGAGTVEETSADIDQCQCGVRSPLRQSDNVQVHSRRDTDDRRAENPGKESDSRTGPKRGCSEVTSGRTVQPDVGPPG